PATVNYWGGSMAAYDYTIEPIDAAAGVVSHEYGHDLGLPDEYDYTPSLGDAVSYWSIMSAGSWAGAIPGTEPVGFSPWAKEFLQASLGGQWFNGETISLDDIGKKGMKFDLDPAVTKGQYNDFVRVNIPDKEVKPTEPFAGDFAYYSSQGNNLNTTASTTVDLTGATSASMTFKLWYDIEADWDYGRVLVNGNPIRGSVTTGTDPNGVGFVHGFTGNSNGWVDAQFDLSAFAGQQIQVSLNYLTDGFVSNTGFFADNMSIVVDGVAVASFDAEADNAALALTGFSRSNGVIATTGRYYLVEFRQYIGVDKGLQNLRRAGQPWSFDPGVVIWYVDQQFSDNRVGERPGEGGLSVVDNDQNTLFYSNGSPARSSYQLKDAALSEVMQSPLNIEWTNATLTDDYLQSVEAFSDRKDYSSPEQPHAGRILPTFGLSIVLDDVEDCDDLNDDIDFNDDDDDACHATVKIKKK
ncbi:MAG: immune inhibitor A, partial [Psychrosphaera sp.]|nr:immune inhibitor A [Psychrosphaera sp.]